MTPVLLLVVVLVAATAFGVYRRRTDGRLRPVRPTLPEAPRPAPAGPPVPPAATPLDGDRLSAADLRSALGDRATLVQFSTAFCAPCRATRVTLDEVAGMLPGVRHVEVDAEAHLDLVRRLDVRRTPTVLILDAAGQVRTRATGAPRKADVIAALGELL